MEDEEEDSFVTALKDQEEEEKKKMRGEGGRDGWMDAVVVREEGGEEEGRLRFLSLLPHQDEGERMAPLVVSLFSLFFGRILWDVNPFQFLVEFH